MSFPAKGSIQFSACNERLIFQVPQVLLFESEYSNVLFALLRRAFDLVQNCVLKMELFALMFGISVIVHHCLMKCDGFLSGFHIWELLFNHVCQSGIT